MQPKHFIGLITMLISLCPWINTQGQIRANFVENTVTHVPDNVLKDYRKSIWESLPHPDGWTNDYEGIFTAAEEEVLTSMITKLENRTGIEIAVITVDTNMVSLDKFDEFAGHLLEDWGVGKKGKDNGIVVCISSGFKKITISRGVGIEKYLSEAMVNHLIAKSFIPLYKKRNYYGGTLNGLIALINKLQPGI